VRACLKRAAWSAVGSRPLSGLCS